MLKIVKWIACLFSGLDWKPKLSDIICSAHFIGNKKGDDELNPSYMPQKFSSEGVKGILKKQLFQDKYLLYE